MSSSVQAQVHFEQDSTLQTDQEDLSDEITNTPYVDDSSRVNLMDLPLELLDIIVRYTVGSEPITVSTASSSTDDPSPRTKWKATNYHLSLLHVNRTISTLAFQRIWDQQPLFVSLHRDEALPFLEVLSEKQKEALRRVVFPKFLVPWDHPIEMPLCLKGQGYNLDIFDVDGYEGLEYLGDLKYGCEDLELETLEMQRSAQGIEKLMIWLRREIRRTQP